MKTIIIENNHLKRGFMNMDFGWGNGYVIIPKGHPLHGKDYNDIEVNIHGGLTFSEKASDLDWKEIKKSDKDGWVIGFDTAHYGDTLERWPKEKVQKEANNLLKQIKKYKP